MTIRQDVMKYFFPWCNKIWLTRSEFSRLVAKILAVFSPFFKLLTWEHKRVKKSTFCPRSQGGPPLLHGKFRSILAPPRGASWLPLSASFAPHLRLFKLFHTKNGQKTRFSGVFWRFWPFLTPPGPCLLYTSPSPRDLSTSRMPSSA